MQESDRNGLVISDQRSINSNVAIDEADFNDPLQGNQRGGVELFNLFNRVNVSQINPFFGAECRPRSSFARPIHAFNARQLQFSVDFEF